MSANYDLIRDAILQKKQLNCEYKGKQRKICPLVLGTKAGKQKVFVWQFDGTSNTNLPVGGDWRCMFVEELTSVSASDGEWHSGSQTSRPQTCVEEVDVAVVT